MKPRTRAALVSAVLLSAGLIWPSEPRRSAAPLEQKAFARPELSLSTAAVPLSDVQAQLPNGRAWTQFLARQRAPVTVFIDPRSGAAANVITEIPLIPGTGKDNRLTLDDVAKALGRPLLEVTPEVVGEAVRIFILNNREVLGIATDHLGPVQAVEVTEGLWQVRIPQQADGIPVRHARVAASIKFGNLILLGASTWDHVRVNTRPQLSADEGVRLGFAYADGREPQDTFWKEPELEIIPYALPGRAAAPGAGSPADRGYAHRLAWVFGFERPPGMERWEVMVDAHTGDVLSFGDTILYDKRRIKGGVYAVTNTGTCPDLASTKTCGALQPGYPMPFADYSPDLCSNSAGVFDSVGTATTTLSCRHIDMDDSCGSISVGATSGDIDMDGTGAHDCNAGSDVGNTSAARTAYYHINKAAEIGRGWLPANRWLSGAEGALLVKTNLGGVGQSGSTNCLAGYTGPPDEQIVSGIGGYVCNQVCCNNIETCCINNDCPGTPCYGSCTRCCFQCRNPGEIASIMVHEWGHALDRHDANQTPSIPSEAYADIAAMYRFQESCVGYGFLTLYIGNGYECSQLTPDRTGYNGDLDPRPDSRHCNTECSASRDADYLKHQDNNMIPGGVPDTPQNHVLVRCGPEAMGQQGPCDKEAHCSAAPATQAAWDFLARDLRSAPYFYDAATASVIANRIFYIAAGAIDEWYSCDKDAGTSHGCAATNAYLQWLVVDDDDGSIFNGTPHMTALYNAFNRLNIACLPPDPVTSGCGGGPLGPPPTVMATRGSFQVNLSWTPVTNAEKYWVFRTEGQAACNLGRPRIATTDLPAYTDTEVADGRQYWYSVVAADTAGTCIGGSSVCTPVDVVATSHYPIPSTDLGTIVSGGALSTRKSDDSYEVLKEALHNNVSRLNRTWQFTNVPVGSQYLVFEGNRPAGNDSPKDDFQFYWAPDAGGAPGTFQIITGAVIAKPLEPAGGLTAAFGSPGISGTFYIQIQDTNQTSGVFLDQVKIDYLAIRTQ